MQPCGQHLDGRSRLLENLARNSVKASAGCPWGRQLLQSCMTHAMPRHVACCVVLCPTMSHAVSCCAPPCGTLWRAVPRHDACCAVLCPSMTHAMSCCAQVDVNTEVGVIHDYALRELRLFTDYGRTSRPLFIVEDNQLAFKQQHLEKLLARWV